MSDIAKRPAAPVANWSDIAARSDVNPLTLVPAEYRPALGRLWACNAHLLPSALALCASVRVYIDDLPITARDIDGICHRLLQPDIRARIRFASELLAEFARLVADAARRNEARDECAARFKADADAASARSRVVPTDLFKLPE